MRCRWVGRIVLVLAWVLVPVMAFAQASITGVVKDTSGAVLPGVTVEASSPALIEKVRTVVSDGAGQYQIVDLRPGTYDVTFTLAGFNAVRHEGVELIGSFAATVNAEMKVGAVSETVTVKGESPVVDTQTVTQQRVMGKEVLDAIPTGRTHFTAATLIPGVSGTRDVGGANNLALTSMSIHGGSTSDTRVMVDGMSTQNAEVNGSSSNHMTDMAGTQEVTVDYAAATAEQAYAGLRINLIPREGGNRFTGSFFGTAVNSSFQGNNLTQDLKDRGLAAPNSINYNYDINPAAGGPIMADRLWFFASTRWVKNANYVGGRFANLNAGDPNAWTYVPNTAEQATDVLSQRSINGRVTWQASAKNKFSFYYDDQGRCWCNYSGGFAVPPSPEAELRLFWPTNHLTTAAWSSPLTSRLLLEARFSDRAETYDYVNTQYNGLPNYDLIQVTEQSTGIAYRSMGSPGNPGTLQFQVTPARIWQASTALSYVTGTHAFKVGFTDVWISRHTDVRGFDHQVSYRFNNGIPNQITMLSTPWSHDERQKAELGIYAQDKWTLDRLTLNLGVRYDYFNSYFPAQQLGPAPLVPNRNLSFPETQGLNFKDLTPRFGAAYDLFGQGKTALKVNIGKYTQAVGISQGIFGEAANPVVRLANQVTRSWTDANGNHIPDCDLLNLQQQDTRTSGGDFCGTVSDLNFGSPTASTTYDPSIATGWSSRPYQWEFSASVQQEVAPRISVNAGYFRRIFGNFLVTDNLLVTSADYSPFSITAPVDPRLPGGGGYVVSGLYDLNPNKVGQVNNLIRFASGFGNQIQHWNGFDVTVDARVRQGVVLQGGLSSGRTTTDNCDVVTKVDNPSPLYCHVDTQFLTQVKMLGAYTIPKVAVQIAGTFQSIPGPQIAANYNAPNALVAPSLGRPLSGGAQNVTVNLVEPGTMYGERSNQVDLRLSKLFTWNRLRTAVNFDLYNALNASPVLTLNNNYAAWQVPLSILAARLFKFSVQLDF
jgi:hypothetical protein